MTRKPSLTKILTLYNVCAVPLGDIMSTVGGYLEYHGGVQYRGGYHDKCGDILSTVGVFSTVGDIMSTVGVILSTVGDIMMHVGDIMSTVMGVQYRGGKSLLLFEYPMVLNTPHGTHDIPPHAS